MTMTWRWIPSSRPRIKLTSELDEFMARANRADVEVEDPLEWWVCHASDYPILSKMAFDLFSCPAMSAEWGQILVYLVDGHTAPENVTGNKAPSPVQKGITKLCNEYHRVSKGDTCSAVASEFKVDLAEFYEWNPAVGSKCENLWAGYYYCVRVAGEKAKATVHTPSPN
ncbi:hypothetical protein HZ326_31013 [Fusarium oxysporum f. sp. albedinis]|nr:hypothetical protein HZ326_31013 [Fusarium oxysporum f. sp. albedinis]